MKNFVVFIFAIVIMAGCGDTVVKNYYCDCSFPSDNDLVIDTTDSNHEQDDVVYDKESSDIDPEIEQDSDAFEEAEDMWSENDLFDDFETFIDNDQAVITDEDSVCNQENPCIKMSFLQGTKWKIPENSTPLIIQQVPIVDNCKTNLNKDFGKYDSFYGCDFPVISDTGRELRYDDSSSRLILKETTGEELFLEPAT